MFGQANPIYKWNRALGYAASGSGLSKTLLAIVLSPVVGFLLVLVAVVSWLSVRSTPFAVDRTFKSFEGNPYDGHTLAATIDQAAQIGGVDPERIYVDKGYRGHDYTGSGSVMIAGNRRGLTPTMRRELKRRSAIEPTIGHMKSDGRLDRNFLLGHVGDAINALLVAAGHNLRLVLAMLALWRARMLVVVAWAGRLVETSRRKTGYFLPSLPTSPANGLAIVQG